MTQRQILWHMKFSELLNEVRNYENSSQYWSSRYWAIPDSTKSVKKSQERAEAKEKWDQIRKDANCKAEALEEWVLAHPYPAESDGKEAIREQIREWRVTASYASTGDEKARILTECADDLGKLLE